MALHDQMRSRCGNGSMSTSTPQAGGIEGIDVHAPIPVGAGAIGLVPKEWLLGEGLVSLHRDSGLLAGSGSVGRASWCALLEGVAVTRAALTFHKPMHRSPWLSSMSETAPRCAGEQSPVLGRQSQGSCGHDSGEVPVGDDQDWPDADSDVCPQKLIGLSRPRRWTRRGGIRRARCRNQGFAAGPPLPSGPRSRRSRTLPPAVQLSGAGRAARGLSFRWLAFRSWKPTPPAHRAEPAREATATKRPGLGRWSSTPPR